MLLRYVGVVGVIAQASLAVYSVVVNNFFAVKNFNAVNNFFGVTLCCYRSSTLRLLSSLTADNKFSSFQRQLNLYGFRKVVKGRESGCYMHPSFLRDNPEKLTEVCYVFVGGACSGAIDRSGASLEDILLATDRTIGWVIHQMTAWTIERAI